GGAAELPNQAGHGGLATSPAGVEACSALRQALARKGAYTYRGRAHGRNRGFGEGSMASRTKPAGGSTVDEAEVVRFSARAAEWWDPRGEMAMLHRFNPVRLAFIKQAACRQFGREEPRLDALAGLRVLDIGCGGGIL